MQGSAWDCPSLCLETRRLIPDDLGPGAGLIDTHQLFLLVHGIQRSNLSLYICKMMVFKDITNFGLTRIEVCTATEGSVKGLESRAVFVALNSLLNFE